MKLRGRHWAIIAIISNIVPLGTVFVITQLIIDKDVSWWWFWSTLILQAVVWAIIGIVLLIKKFKKAEKPKIRISPKTATAKAIEELKKDLNNPDNFLIIDAVINKVGQQGKPITPILHLSGRGTETGDKIDAVINLNEPKGEISWLRNRTKLEIDKTIKLMAENPESEVIESTTTGQDMFGRPTSTTVTKKVREEEKIEHDEKQKADMQNVM